MVYLVRHAHAGSQRRWSGPDHDRPLSLRGSQQANGLLATLRDHPVSRILASPAVRCQHVVDPAMQAAVLYGHGEQLRGLLRLLVGSVRFDGPLRLKSHPDLRRLASAEAG